MEFLQQREQDTGNDDLQWVVVTETIGTTQTEMIVGYLRDHGIQAMAAGSTSLGLLTGANSAMWVMVPEEDAGSALYLLEPGDELDKDGDVAEEPDDASSTSAIDKAVLGATAFALNPLGTGIALVLSIALGSEEGEKVSNLVDCPQCGVGLELSEEEIEQRWFSCRGCDQVIRLDEVVVCPTCQTELELDADEQSRGWYICPECHWAVRIKYS